MKNAVLFNIFGFFASIASVFAQIPEYNFRHYSIEEGLPTSQIYDAIQDLDGYMWFATDKGLVKYNGYEFNTFSSDEGLNDNVIFSLFQDFKKRIWMISLSGNIYYYEKNKINEYKFNHITKDLIIGSYQFYIAVDTLENVFVDCTNGIYKINKNGQLKIKYKSYLKNTSTKIIIDKTYYNNEIKCIGFKVDIKKNIDLITLNNNKTDSLNLVNNDNGRSYIITLKNKKNLLSIGNSLYELQNNELIFKKHFDSEIIKIFEDNKQRLWVCTSKGIYFYSKKGSFADSRLLLASNYISSVTCDSENGYWITTIDDGIFYLTNDAILNYKNDLNINTPLVLTASKSHIYAGNFNGTISLLNMTNFNSNILNKTSKLGINSLFYDTTNNSLFVGNDIHGRFKENKLIQIKKTIKNESCLGGFKKYKNEMFSTSFGNIIKIKNDSSFIEFYSDSISRILCFHLLSNSDLILGTIKGAFKYNSKQKELSTINKDLNEFRIDAINELNGYLIFSVQGKGLLFYKNDGTLKWINKSDGLCSNNIGKLFVFKNEIWCSSFNGLSTVTITNSIPLKYKIKNLSRKEGLLSNEINDIYILNDTVWVASKKGISFFDINTDFINPSIPKVYFTKFQINNKEVDIQQSYVLKSKNNNISIGFESPLYKNDGKQTYQFTLLNKKDTIYGKTKNRSVQFLSLEKGDYTFLVKATNNSNIQSIKAAKIEFSILPIWYDTLWFKLLCTIALSGIGLAFYKYRISEIRTKYMLEKQQATLQLTAIRAQMNPHFIFNVMNSIRNFMHNNDVNSAEKYLVSFAKLIRYTLDNSTVQEVSLAEEINALENYAALELQRLSKSFEFNINISDDIDLDEISIPSLLLQPFVENAIKHGIENLDIDGKIFISIFTEGDIITIIIEDNGMGTKHHTNIEATNNTNHVSHGTKLTFERILAYNKAYSKNIKAEILDISDINPNQHGTRVKITI